MTWTFIHRITNDMNKFNYRQAEVHAAIITKAQGDRASIGQLAKVLLGIENQNSPIFACFGNDNLIY